MGFRWNSARSTTHYIGASVKNGQLTPFTAGADEDDWAITTTGSPYGPVILLNTFNSALEYIKVAFVLSR